METAPRESLDQGNLIRSATSISADVTPCRGEKVAGERGAGILIIGAEPTNHTLHAYLASTRQKQRNKLCAAPAHSRTPATAGKLSSQPGRPQAGQRQPIRESDVCAFYYVHAGVGPKCI